MSPWLDGIEADSRELALDYAHRDFSGLAKLNSAERLCGAPVPGTCIATRMARVSDARFWRRAVHVLLLREREQFFLRLRLVGKSAEAYVSDVQLSSRLVQLNRQAEWTKRTVSVPRYLAPGDAAEGGSRARLPDFLLLNGQDFWVRVTCPRLKGFSRSACQRLKHVHLLVGNFFLTKALFGLRVDVIGNVVQFFRVHQPLTRTAP